ncbi:hypothetical protein IAT38_001125 [Cryptococcus sp. DSM 104549]
MATSQSKYVPPSRRAGYVPSSSSTPPSSARRGQPFRPKTQLDPRAVPVDILFDIFQHPQGSTLTWFAYKGEDEEETGRSSPPKVSPADPAPSTADTTPSNDVTPSPTPTPTVPVIPPTPSHPLHYVISYITVFPRAHPLWEDEHELWSHSNMEKLIADWEGPKKNFGRPIPVFTPANRANYHTIFNGWWVIDRIHVAEPRSSEVNDMMKIKEKNGAFSRSGRTAQAWDQSMSYTWVRIRLSKCTKEGLKDPTTLGEGQGERYLLEVGGLDEELKVLEKANKQDGLPNLSKLKVADDGEGDDEKK